MLVGGSESGKNSVEGLRKLLDFLEMSFGGGTDVTGALRVAMEEMSCSENGLEGSDWLLLTDGEIPDVGEDVLRELKVLQKKGLKVHGLLVGSSRESEVLDKMCTEVHDFLVGWDMAYVKSVTSEGGVQAQRQWGRQV
mmetsp:Transcript_62498/g.74001  ORF Transcript_62498/g.74001 Transcript_62498/m.74001 type:complete len:138 (+) Transcript_62498:68-481(+)